MRLEVLSGTAVLRWLAAVAVAVLAVGSGARAALAISSAAEVCDPAANPCPIDAAYVVDDGAFLDFGTRDVIITRAGRLIVEHRTAYIDAGSLTVEAGGQIDAIGDDSHEGGSVTIGVVRDFTSAGTLRADGGLCGGVFTLDAGGAIKITGGQFSADGLRLDACGGEIVLSAGAGGVNLAVPVSAIGGDQDAGGLIDITSSGDIVASKLLDASGGDLDGGSVSLTADGDVLLGGPVRSNGGGTSGFGGDFTIDAGGRVELSALVSLTGAGDIDFGGGAGGDVDISAGTGVTISGGINATGAPPDGDGGTLWIVTDGPIIVSGTRALDFSANGSDAAGGEINMMGGDLVNISAPIDVTGGEIGGGQVDIDGSLDVQLTGRVVADGSGSGGAGGSIAVSSGGQLTVSGVLRARGTRADGFGGDITLTACYIEVTGDITAIPTGGTITIVSREQMSVSGALTAGGENRFVYRSANKPPKTAGAQLLPTPILQLDPTLAGCPACGDGEVVAPEECDDGNTVSGDGCSATCRIERCGDGIVQAGLGEQCDDGNTTSCDGCSDSCQIESCGDGIVCASQGEQCDDGNTTSCDGCSDSCQIESCGDGIVCAAMGEQCDDGNTVSGDGCSATCRMERCGDGIVQATLGEQCDDGNTTSCDGCSDSCQIESCGDGLVCAGMGEQCDDGNTAAGDGCSPRCFLEPPPGRIPGGGSKKTDCLLELVVRNPGNPPDRKGFPNKRQSCVDNDPSCDADPAPGVCGFELWMCVGAADPLLPQCTPMPITAMSVDRPSAKNAARRARDAALRADLLAAVGALGPFPVSGPECGPRVLVEVPLKVSRRGRVRKGKQVVKVKALAPPLPKHKKGIKDSDAVRFTCLPPRQ